MPARKKIALIGAGNIGGELAALAARKELGDVLLFDIPEKVGVAKGKALDLEQNGAVLGYDAGIKGTSSWDDIAGADVVIITAGVPRKPGMSRDDLLTINLKIIRGVGREPEGQVPQRLRHRGLEPARRHGLRAEEGHRLPRARRSSAWPACSTRAASSCSSRARPGCRVKDVRAMVLGGHGDTMVPVLSYCTINGVPVTPADRRRQAGGHRRPHPQRRRRDRQADGDQRLLRARLGGHPDGRGLPARREAPAARAPPSWTANTATRICTWASRSSSAARASRRSSASS